MQSIRNNSNNQLKNFVLVFIKKIFQYKNQAVSFLIISLLLLNSYFADSQPIPTPVITGNLSFCAGGNTTLSTASVTGYTYCWQNTSASTSWQNVGSAGFSAGAAFHLSFAFNGLTPYVAYQDGANANKTSVMKLVGTSWVNVGNPGFSAGGSDYHNLAFSGNTPYVAFRDWNQNSKATVMKFDGTNWVHVGNPGFTAGEAGFLKFAINEGVPYVAFQDESNNYAATVMKFNGTSWVYAGNPGFSAGGVNYLSFAFGGNTPYVAYADASNTLQKTTVMKFDGTNWVNVGNPQFTPGATRNHSLAIDGNTPYVAYAEDANNFKTSVMKFDGTNWVNVGNAGFSAGGSFFQSIAINNGIPYVAYADDANNYKTTVMKFNGTNWISVGGVGFSPDYAYHQHLVFNGNTPYVAFANGSNDYKATVMKYEIGCAGTNNSIQINIPGTYTVTVTNASASSATSIPVTVTENSTPTVNCPANTDVCLNVPVFTLTGGSPAGGVYIGPGVSNNQFNPASTGTGLKNIIYTYTDPATGCSNSCSFTINVKASPVVNCNVGTMYVCLNQAPFILANVSPAGGTFSGTGVSNGMFNAAVAGVGDHTVTYTVTDPATGCSNSCSFIVHVWALPVVSCNVGTMYVCHNQAPFVLSNVSPAGGTFSGTGVSNGMFNAAVAGVGSHTVTYTYTDSYTSCSNSCSFTVTVRPLPVVSCNNGNMSVCLNQAPFALSNGSPAGGTFSGTGVSNGMFNPATAGVGSHTIIYTYTDQTTSCSNSCSFTITVNNSTAPVITPVSNNINLNLDASGNKTITLADVATVTGGCNSNASVRISPTAFNCSSIGTQSVLVEATDGVFGTPTPGAVSFSGPIAIAADNTGNFYIADRGTESIRKISPSGLVSLFAGGSSAGYLDGQGTTARFNTVSDIAVDASGNIYVADAGNRRIRKITSSGLVTTIAGSGGFTSIDGNGTAAGFESPNAIAVDASGNIFVADASKIRKIDPAGNVLTVAGTTAGFADGNGLNAKFWGPSGLTTDASGNLYIADGANYRVRKMTSAADVSTLAGGAGQFGFLHAIVRDAAGNFYVCDGDNYMIKKITVTGTVTSIAGSGSAGANNGTGTAASFNGIFGMAISGGNLFVSEFNNHKIRKVTPGGVVTTFAGNGVAGSQNGNISGITGNYSSLPIPVTIKDVIAPVITPVSNNIIIPLNANGTRAITLADVATVTDHCNNSPAVRISPSAFDCSNVGTQTVTVEATDGTLPTPSNPGAVKFNQPNGIVFDNAGNLYIVDRANHLIRKIDVSGNTSTIGGNGTMGFADGIASSSMFKVPIGIAVDAAGNVYVGDDQNHRIRKISPSGIVSTFAGSGVMGNTDGTGINAQFNSPAGLAFDNSGNLYVADKYNYKIRKISPSGVVTSLPGFFYIPGDVAVDASGNIYVAEFYSVSRISATGNISLIAGSQSAWGYQDGPAGSALFLAIQGIEIDNNANIFVTDASNNRVRKITNTGQVETIVQAGYPTGIAFSPGGVLYFSDPLTHNIYKINPNNSITNIAGTLGVYGTSNGNVGSNGSGNFSTLQIPVTITDNTAPSITCPSNITTPTTATHPNQTGWATASDNCTAASTIVITYTDNTQGCNINRTWKATDAGGNFSTCLQTIAIPQMSVTSGPDMYILYGALGYVGCKTLTPVITGGVAPYTYLWTSTQASVNNVTTSSIFVCNTTEITHTYTVTVTGATGCAATATVVLHFIDISCSNNGNNTKVSVCLRPQGNASNCHNVCVSQNAAPGLVSNGSYYGQCLPGCEVPIQARGAVTGSTLLVGGNEKPKHIQSKADMLKSFNLKKGMNDKRSVFNVTVLNNPTETSFRLIVNSPSIEKIMIRLFDATGRMIGNYQTVVPGEVIEFGKWCVNGMYFAEITQGENFKVVKLIKQ